MNLHPSQSVLVLVRGGSPGVRQELTVRKKLLIGKI